MVDHATIQDRTGGLSDAIPQKREPGFWNGDRHCYIAESELSVAPELKLHQATADDVDPVTYEVVRYSLLNLNLEHNALIQKLAVSQLIIHSRDYQTAMMTEVGETLFVGPGVQYFAKSAELSIQYTLERRASNPGIAPGDMFFSNDAFVGAAHQQDATLAAPVFVGDELFCWVSNTLHYQDVGGTEPGSFCHHATDAWQEATHWPPVKLVEGGRLRDDIERLFIRQSRFPVEIGMDLRAAIAANDYTRQKLGQLIERYGPAVVKAVMYGTLDAGQKLFAKRLSSIPDGRWSHRFYTEGALPGDDTIYSMQVNITKLGERLIVDNRGTDPQIGSINVTFGPFAGSVLAGIVGQVVPDLSGAFGGAYRMVEFRPDPGRILCADYPAAISPTPNTAVGIVNAAAIATAKMLACGDGDSRKRILGALWTHPGGAISVGGQTGSGEHWMILGSEAMLGSFGGSPDKDGSDFAGHWWMPGVIAPNVEDVESHNPVVYLYRRALQQGMDGSGRHRGGSGFEYAICSRSSSLSALLSGMGEAFPKGAGIGGANPGSRARVTIVRGGQVMEAMAKGKLPGSVAEMGGESEELPFKSSNVMFEKGDVIEGVFPSVPGYGDPLLRSAAAVIEDIRNGLIDEATALRVYGVASSGEIVDEIATRNARHAIRRERLGGREPGEIVTPPEGARQVGDMLHFINGRWWCNGADLGPASESYKAGATMREMPIRQIGAEFATPFDAVADRIVFREFICPVTGYRVEGEIVLSDQESLDDIRLIF